MTPANWGIPNALRNALLYTIILGNSLILINTKPY